MILYTDNAGHWVGTMADARRDLGIRMPSPPPTEVPTDKTGLLAFLNTHHVGGAMEQTERLVAPPVLPTAILAAPMASTISPHGRWKLEQGREVDQIVEFILDESNASFTLSTIIGAAIERLARMKQEIQS